MNTNHRSGGLFTLALACALGAPPAMAQHDTRTGAADTLARIPALEQFHEVIFPLWHQAWPEKNTAMLADLLPRVREGIEAVAGAALPGILREKKAAWERGVTELRKAGGAYASAAADHDSVRLLAAAEQLHARYEELTRVIRPAMKEITDFHVTLYRLYHHELPANDTRGMRASVAALKTKMAALNAAALPDRWKTKSGAFTAARRNLDQSLTALDSVIAAGDAAAVRSAVTEMHGRFESLNSIFE